MSPADQSDGAGTFGAVSGEAPSELHAFLVLTAYLAVSGPLAFYLFQLRDIPGASRS